MFVILCAAMPSRLLSAFPPGVGIRRVPLDIAIQRVEEFLPLSSGGRADEAANGIEARQVELEGP